MVLDEYINPIMSTLSKLEVVQLVDIRETNVDVEPILGEESIGKCSDLLRRIYHLIDILEISEPPKKLIGSDKSVPKPVVLHEKSSHAQLDDVEDKLAKIEEEVIPLSESPEELEEEKTGLENDEPVLKYFEEMGLDSRYQETTKFLYTISGWLNLADLDDFEHQTGEQFGKLCLILKGKPVEDKLPITLVTLGKYMEDVNEILASLNFNKFTLKTTHGLKDVQNRLKEIKEEELRLKDRLQDIKEKWMKDMLVMREICEIEKKIAETKLKLGKTERVSVLEGWIPETKVDKMLDEVNKVSHGYSLVRLSKPESDENVPIEFNNPRFFKSFEPLIELFGLPKYTEVDPTPLLAITFPLIFGLMFGDVGHGAIFALAGFFMTRLGNKSYADWGTVILSCGISAVIFGFLYGSLFGNEEILPILWISPAHDIMGMIGIALFVGVIHMGLGLIVNAINKFWKDGSLSILSSVGKLWFLLGEVTIIAKVFEFPIPIFIELAKYSFTPILIYGVVIPALMMLVAELIHGLKKVSISQLIQCISMWAFEIFETFSAFLSNTMSYSRILALALVHAMMCLAIFMIADVTPFPLNILILIGGTIAVLVLEGMIVFIHTIRLHYYEWFSKFYDGGGIKYEPFMVEREYTRLSK